MLANTVVGCFFILYRRYFYINEYKTLVSFVYNMPRCAICAEKQKRLYQLCSTCVGDEKQTCFKCYSKMLFMCPEKSSCTAIHMLCAWCRQAISADTRNTESNNSFIESYYYAKKANALRCKQLHDVSTDRHNLLNTIENLGRMLSLYDRQRSRNLQDMVQERRDMRRNLE
jgi:hypothetical protein